MPSWSVILPVKRLSIAKSRLHVVGVERADLALAFASDTLSALLSSDLVARVVVVTDDPRAREVLPHTSRVVVVDDEPDAGLNPALAHGARFATLEHPGDAIAAVSSDLPALRPEDLDRVLADAAGHGGPAFVADIGGLGTTLLAAPVGAPFAPLFGRRSRAAHRAAGCREISDAGRSIRRDVDTEVDLWDAERMGVGPHTRELLASKRST